MGCCKPITRYIPPFDGWVPYNATIPKMYWDTYSMEQRTHAMCEMLHKVACYADMLGIEIGNAHDEIDKLQAQFDDFKAGLMVDYYERALDKWLTENSAIIFEQFARGVYFGLTLDGHFVAYIPESWSDIVFDTGMVWGAEDYGRLILRYDVDSPYSVEQP